MGTPTEFSDGFGQASVKDNYPTWTVGFDYKISPDFMVYITSRRGVRPKNLNFPLFESAPVTCPSKAYSMSCVDLRGYQTIKQERVTDVEIGEKLSFNVAGAQGRLNVAAFYSRYDNATQFLSNSGSFLFPRGTLDAPPSSIIINAADLNIYGVEIDASVSPDRNLTLGFNGAITKRTWQSCFPSIRMANSDQMSDPSAQIRSTG